MLAKVFKFAAVATALVSTALARPLSLASEIVPRSISFDNFGGISAFNGFDAFFGVDNFIGLNNQIILQQENLICDAQAIVIVQQNLLILQEVAKQVILTQLCVVEVQQVVFQQFIGGLGTFQADLLRLNNRVPGYDQNIANFLPNIIGANGLNTNNLGFDGKSLGKNIVVPSGNTWDDAKSPASVKSAVSASKEAIQSSKGNFTQGE